MSRYKIFITSLLLQISVNNYAMQSLQIIQEELRSLIKKNSELRAINSGLYLEIEDAQNDTFNMEQQLKNLKETTSKNKQNEKQKKLTLINKQLNKLISEKLKNSTLINEHSFLKDKLIYLENKKTQLKNESLKIMKYKLSEMKYKLSELEDKK